MPVCVWAALSPVAIELKAWRDHAPSEVSAEPELAKAIDTRWGTGVRLVATDGRGEADNKTADLRSDRWSLGATVCSEAPTAVTDRKANLESASERYWAVHVLAQRVRVRRRSSH